MKHSFTKIFFITMYLTNLTSVPCALNITNNCYAQSVNIDINEMNLLTYLILIIPIVVTIFNILIHIYSDIPIYNKMKVHFWLCIMMIIIFSVLYFSFSDYEHCSYSIKHAELQNNNIRYQFVVNYGKKTRVHLKEFNRDQYNIDYTLTKIKDDFVFEVIDPAVTPRIYGIDSKLTMAFIGIILGIFFGSFVSVSINYFKKK